MILQVVVGLWLCVVTLGATFLGAEWSRRRAYDTTASTLPAGKLETVKLRMISVPIVANGGIDGYVVMRPAYLAYSAELKSASVRPDDLVTDEAFRLIYAGAIPRDQSVAKQSFADLSAKITESVNKKLGQPVIKEILIQEFNFIHKTEVRKGQSP
jgi:hypothetical protein